ncbi:MAG: DNA phosphorothioation-associated protein 4 [Luteolibacter sp.]
MRRIQRDVRHEEFVKSLTSGEHAIFRDIWRVLLFASAYGVSQGGRTSLQKVDSNKAMPESYFSTPGWRGFLYLLGFADSDTSDHLRNDEEQQNKLITAFEEYANFGLEEMQRRISTPSKALSELVGILLDSSIKRVVKADLSDLI